MSVQVATISRVPQILKTIATLKQGEWATFRDVDWDEYEELLAELEGNPGKRVYYNEGVLEIMSVSFAHERRKELLARMVDILAEESEMELIPGGSTTLKLQGLRKGAEPDASFFLRNADLMMGKEDYDLRHDPPPDLVIEVDISHPSHSKFDLYAKLGVPEFWRYDDSRIEVYELVDGEYVERDESPIFSFVSAAELSKFLDDYHDKGQITAIRAFREFVNSRLQTS
ncbi:MAG: Uma2 family endonuclease [Acidobacteriota bacterium]